MKVSVLVPFRPDESGERVRLRDFVHERFIRMAISCGIEPEIVYADDRGDDPDLFNRGQAINRAYDHAHNDTLLIMDADTTFDRGGPLAFALRACERDGYWRLPESYCQLTPSATKRLRDSDRFGEPFDPTPDCALWLGRGVAWSGLVIVPRAAFESVGGADERYVGHGADDVALGLALDTLYGPHVRSPYMALHLWHERGPQEESAHRADLTEWYESAVGNQFEMRCVVEGKRL